jgi:hypothetical protein
MDIKLCEKYIRFEVYVRSITRDTTRKYYISMHSSRSLQLSTILDPPFPVFLFSCGHCHQFDADRHRTIRASYRSALAMTIASVWKISSGYQRHLYITSNVARAKYVSTYA